MKISEYIVSKLREIVARYDDKHNPKQLFMCVEPAYRNSCRNSKYNIPTNEPQCPVFQDNRCCGCCDLTTTCKYVVPCNSCSGWGVAAMGGYTRYYMNDANKTAEFGRMKDDNVFDWDYYHYNQLISRAKAGKYFRYNLVWYKIVKSADAGGMIEAVHLKRDEVCRIDLHTLNWKNTMFLTEAEYKCIQRCTDIW